MPEEDDNDLDLDLDLTFGAEPEPEPAPPVAAPPEQPKPATFKKRVPESRPTPPVEVQPRQEAVPAKFPPPRPAPTPEAKPATPTPAPKPTPTPTPTPQPTPVPRQAPTPQPAPAPQPTPAPAPQAKPAPAPPKPQPAPEAAPQPAQIPQKRTAPTPPPQAEAPANPLEAPRRKAPPRQEREPRKRRTQQTRPPREQKSPQGSSLLQNKKLLIGIPAALLCLALIAFAVLRDKKPKGPYPVDVDAIQNGTTKTTAPGIGSPSSTGTDAPAIDRTNETPDERDERAEAVLGNFFGASKPEAMLSYVRDPKRVAPLMADYYGRERYQSHDFLGLKSSLQEAEAVGPGFYAAEADIGSPRSRTIILEDTPEGMRIDWEYYVQYNPMNWMTFIKETPSPPSVEPMDFRVLARIVPDYRHPFTDEKRYLAIDLVTLNSDAPPIIGYAVRSEPLGQELQAFLEGKQEEMCILKLEFPARSKPGDTAVYIRELVNPHWIITDETTGE